MIEPMYPSGRTVGQVGQSYRPGACADTPSLFSLSIYPGSEFVVSRTEVLDPTPPVGQSYMSYPKWRTPVPTRRRP